MQCEDCSFNVLGRSWGFLSVVVEGAGMWFCSKVLMIGSWTRSGSALHTTTV